MKAKQNNKNNKKTKGGKKTPFKQTLPFRIEKWTQGYKGSWRSAQKPDDKRIKKREGS